MLINEIKAYISKNQLSGSVFHAELLFLRGVLYIKAKKNETALELFQESRKIYNLYCAPDSRKIAEIEMFIAQIYCNLKMYEAAKAYYQHRISQMKTSLFDRELKLQCLFSLASTLTKSGENEKSK